MNVLAVILQLLLGITVESTLSGLYVDNGLDQTVVQRAISREEKREVEQEILHLLGLPGRPRPRRRLPRLLGGSAPKFLLDVYKSMSSSTRPTRSEFELSGRDLHAIDESDVIMSFTSHSEKVPRVRHERGKRLWFDVSEVPPDEGIVGAELRLYQTSNYSLPSDETYVITIYTVLDINSVKELELVESIKTKGDHEGWLIFNMTGPVTSWVLHPVSNKGLYLSIHSDSNPGHELLPEDLGIVTWKEGEDKEPFMVAFLRSSGLLASQPKSRSKRQTSRRRKKTTDTSYMKNPLMDKSSWPHPQRSCQIQTLYVSFKDLDWQDWIIAPDGYGAFYCSGECNFPLNAHMNATNHAVVQTLVHLMNPLQVPKPCCAPTKLTAISVLYFFDESKVILKKYKNMVVKSCGCH